MSAMKQCNRLKFQVENYYIVAKTSIFGYETSKRYQTGNPYNLMKLLVTFLAIIILPLLAHAQQLRVAVAANAQFVAKALATEFKKETGIDAELIVGASGKFTTQMEQGAPFDVFLSADMKYPQELYSKGLTTSRPKEYAYGKLVFWTLSNVNISKGLPALTQPAFNKVAIANPKLAPYGEAAVQALIKLNLYQKVQPKIVYGESIAQVNQYLLTGVVSAALTAKSVVLDAAQAGKGKWVEVPSNLYQPIAQGAVILRSAAHQQQAQKFYTFIFSRRAKQIFENYGYQ
jgi:molybdate transport system substrate-binding protein